jgi:hypothetical protein
MRPVTAFYQRTAIEKKVTMHCTFLLTVYAYVIEFLSWITH